MQPATIAQVTLALRHLHCSSCLDLVEETLSRLKGVTVVGVIGNARGRFCG
jgi:copper chaperone CopZ